MRHFVGHICPAVTSCAVALGLALTATGAAGAEKDAPVTPSGFRVAPAGTEFGVSRIDIGFQGPMGAALSADGRWLLAASSGASRFHSADLFDVDRGGAYGLRLLPGRLDLECVDVLRGGMGARQGVVRVLDVKDNGALEDKGTVPTPGFAAGLAYGETPQGPRLYVVNNTIPPFGQNTPGHSVTVIDVSKDPAVVTGHIELGVAAQPLGVAFARDGRTAIVTNWIGRSVSVIDTATERAAAPITLSDDVLQADHPSAVATSPVRDEAYIANANTDTISVLDSRTGAVVATIAVALVPGGPKGANPVGLAVAPDGATLYVTLAGENAVAVVDLDTRAVRGFIPTAWYPADVEITPDRGRLVITNA